MYFALGWETSLYRIFDRLQGSHVNSNIRFRSLPSISIRRATVDIALVSSVKAQTVALSLATLVPSQLEHP